jgi:hypothetical protein
METHLHAVKDCELPAELPHREFDSWRASIRRSLKRTSGIKC